MLNKLYQERIVVKDSFFGKISANLNDSVVEIILVLANSLKILNFKRYL